MIEFNFFQFQKMASLFFIFGMYLQWKFSTSILILFCFLFVAPFLGKIINRLNLFFLLGLLRGGFFEQIEENYTYKTTKFEFTIVDYQIKEHGIYLIGKDFIFSNIECPMQLDAEPIFPSKARMKISQEIYEELKQKNIIGAHAFAIGRFMVPAQSFLPEKIGNSICSGKIKEINLLNEVPWPFFKEFLRKKIENAFSKISSCILKAVFLSDSFAIEKETRNSFQKAGLAHLLGVSILNLSVLIFLLLLLFKFLIGFFPRLLLFIPFQIIDFVFSVLILLFYCYLIGFEYPLMRALFTTGLSLIALYFGRSRSLEILFLAAACVLCIFPDAIFDISFQLSFGGVLGIHCFNFKSDSKIMNSFLTTLAATLATFPIMIYHFQTINIQPFIANLIAIPYFVFLLVPIAIAWIIFAFFNLEFLLTNFLEIIIAIFIKLVSLLECVSLNFSSIPIDLFYIFIYLIGLILFASFKEKIRYIFLSLSCFIFFYGFFSIRKDNFILVHPYAIGYFKDSKIYLQQKENYVTQIWQEAYNREVVANSDYFKKELNKRIIVDNKIALKFEYSEIADEDLNIKNYYINYFKIQKQVEKIEL